MTATDLPGSPMRVLICGSRDWPKRRMVEVVLEGLHVMYPNLVVISGMARGADRHAADWAKRTAGVELVPFPADWTAHKRAAGPIRNRQMLTEGRPDLVVGFSDDLASSRGTKDMVTIAEAAGVPTYVVSRPAT